MHYHHLIYTSVPAQDLSEQEVFELLDCVRLKNAALGVSGMLLYDGESFFQVLEGPEAILEALYEKISKDPRHSNIVKLIFEPIEVRAFENWSMGYSKVDKSVLRKIEGLNDFFQGKECLKDIDRGRAMDLLNAYAKGGWRLA